MLLVLLLPVLEQDAVETVLSSSSAEEEEWSSLVRAGGVVFAVATEVTLSTTEGVLSNAEAPRNSGVPVLAVRFEELIFPIF